jgi:two-component system, OmpR family, KDP operon response regulator KdpE
VSTKKNTILVVDDEPQTKKMLEIVLAKDDFSVESCKTGRQAVSLAITLKPDLILLDLNLPDMNGNDVISALREWSQVPIIILTARFENEDVMRALDLGADDYVIKPFHMGILQARINACLRKGAVHQTGEPELVNGALRMNLVRHEVSLGGIVVSFTPKEYNLLRYFMIHCGKMLTHKDILHEVWGSGHGDDAQYLRVFIGQIREKIEKNPAMPVVITTEPGVGYRMEIAALAAQLVIP